MPIPEEEQPESSWCALAALNAEHEDQTSHVVTTLISRFRQMRLAVVWLVVHSYAAIAAEILAQGQIFASVGSCAQKRQLAVFLTHARPTSRNDPGVLREPISGA